jgi:hypothetical protein
MANTPQKATASTASTSASSPVERPRQALTDDMPQPPGSARRSRRVAKKRRTGPFVKYVGHAAQRTISPAEWKTLAHDNVPKDGYQFNSWDMKNDYIIESDKFTDEQLDYLLIDDVQGNGAHSFLEVDYDSDGNLAQVVEDEDDEAKQ